MKRGLKVCKRRAQPLTPRCYNLYPDEKGTESTTNRFSANKLCWVTTYTPMKRGLKASIRASICSKRLLVTTYTPMKRGLKGWMRLPIDEIFDSYNLYPDEKGTERYSIAFRTASSRGYNLYPDEKGTESNGSRCFAY